jgi:branched-chain amino acid transport system substrate-binding protein
MIRWALLLGSLLSVVVLSATPLRAEILIGVAVPLTGPAGWIGEANQKGVEKVVADLNAQGGVLGERLEILTVDDYCHGEQAVAAARKLVDAGVEFVVGHPCSAAAIPASDVYEAAGVVLFSPAATNPRLTERGLWSVFRLIGRDDAQGHIAGDFLADRFGDQPIAILHDGGIYGKGLAGHTRARLNERGIKEVTFEALEPGLVDYTSAIGRVQAVGAEVLYYAGFAPEAALILRQARDREIGMQLVSGDALGVEDFWLIAGSAGEGTLFTARPDPRNNPKAARLREVLVAENYDPPLGTFSSYSAVEAWAQAVQRAGTSDAEAVAKTLRAGEFDTMVGRIGFDEKGDVTGYGTFVWYVWKEGEFVLLKE